MFGHRITLFRLFDFSVRIDATWLILAGLIVWGLARGYFPNLAPGLAPAVYWVMGGAGLIGLAASIILHELAHALVARRYDMPIHGITLFLFGGIAEMEDEPSSPKGEALMAIAGPLASLSLAALCWLAATVPSRPEIVLVLSYLALINGLLAAFNLIPAFPLDGGRVLRALLWGWRKDLAWATRIASTSGQMLGWAVMLYGLYATALGHLIAGLWWLMIGLFIRGAAIAAARSSGHAFNGQKLDRFVERHPLSVPPDVPLTQVLADYAEPYALHSLPVTGEDGRLLGRIDLDAVRSLPPRERDGMTAGAVMQPYSRDSLIDETASAAAAHRQMREHRRRYLLVVSQERLTGVLSRQRLQAYLTARRPGASVTSTTGR